MSPHSDLPYWLAGGTEICVVCHQPYVLENERRCAGCDEALCEHCAQREHGSAEWFCSPCHAESAKSPQRRKTAKPVTRVPGARRSARAQRPRRR